MYEKEFDSFGNILKIDNFQEICLNEYDDYLDTVIEFNGTKEDILLVYEKYKDCILKMILNSNELKDMVMTEKNSSIRHDIKLEEIVDISKITNNILDKTNELNHFEERFRNIILFEIAKLINCYGIEDLNLNQEIISKEIRLGIFSAKSDKYFPKKDLEKLQQRIDLDEKFGSESIPYIENFELLKERVLSLKHFSNVPEEIQRLDILLENLYNIQTMLDEKNSNVLDLLKESYSEYENINRQILLNRLNINTENLIQESDDESLFLLHFIPAFNESSDFSQDDFFKQAANDLAISYIENKYKRKYNPEVDSEEFSRLTHNYMNSRNNPFDLSLRIPLKNKYTNSSFHSVITAPHTNLSCSICKTGTFNSHLNRKIAIGFSVVPLDSIKTINKGYNNSLDCFSFKENSVAIPEVLEHIQNGGINETLIDWTQISPSYIMVIKDSKDIDKELLLKVEDFNKSLNLPVRIYDAYEIQRKKDVSEVINENPIIEGAYNVSDLSLFSKINSKGNLLQKIKSILNFKELGGMQK